MDDNTPKFELGTPFPGSNPTQPLAWPSGQHQSNQIQQTKGTAKAQVASAHPSTQPSTPTVAPRTTPPAVTHVRVVLRNHPSDSTLKNLTVQFNHPGTNPYFSGANVYTKQSGKEPVLVAGGAKSPLTFSVTKSPIPTSVYVTSVSNWGETDILTAPSKSVRLV